MQAMPSKEEEDKVSGTEGAAKNLFKMFRFAQHDESELGRGWKRDMKTNRKNVTTMKKILFAATAAAMLIGCSKDITTDAEIGRAHV